MALNKVVLMGRITHDLEIRQTMSGVACLTFAVAVERNYSKQGEEKQTDFINCVAWRQTAEFIGKYFGKGRMIAVEGQLRTRTYDDKNGTKHYLTEVFVDNASFTGEPKQGADNTCSSAYGTNGSYSGNGANAPQNAQQAAQSEDIGDLS
ncbi:MAG: single-stranded DNA-binding protein, partial [Ruminococcus sp.]|nr:single-stranded DNA-binding protein [Ruminococcus sp.]